MIPQFGREDNRLANAHLTHIYQPRFAVDNKQHSAAYRNSQGKEKHLHPPMLFVTCGWNDSSKLLEERVWFDVL